MLAPAFEYVLPVIRGIQAGREYYVSMCPARLLPKLLPLETEALPPEARSQRQLNKNRVPAIAQYILDNPTNYTLAAIAACIDANIAFEPLGTEAEARKIGRLRVPMDAKLRITDGQHRRAALELAMKQKPELGYETVALILFLDTGLADSQQQFADLNRHPVPLDASLNLLYEHRQPEAKLVKAAIKQVPVLRALTDLENSCLANRSSKLFTLAAIYRATLALLARNQEVQWQQQVELTARYWQAVCNYMPDWQLVAQKRAIAAEVRRDFIHSSAIALTALGHVGSNLLPLPGETWDEHLSELEKIDWSRSNPDWQGTIISRGNVTQSSNSTAILSAYLKRRLRLPLTLEEEKLLLFKTF